MGHQIVQKRFVCFAKQQEEDDTQLDCEAASWDMREGERA